MRPETPWLLQSATGCESRRRLIKCSGYLGGGARCTSRPGSTFPVGVGTVTCIATDRADNAAAETTTVTVVTG
jgi:hypothetical protein